MDREEKSGARPGQGDGAPETGESPRPKSIVLFSDGTGNSSGKLFKTNVWRMYEAVDLGPPEPKQPTQIAFYDDGVGTSGFKPLAILGGVFGVGLKRNVLDIYRYACRNYRPAPGQQPGQENVDGGDRIFGFGFSRGAFTMRIAIAMIARVGLAVTEDEAELDRRAAQAWRTFRLRYRPRSRWAPSNLWRRWIVGESKADSAARRALHEERSRNLHPIIQFVGVWDTVSAYGGPVSELTEAVDNWLVRLSMPNYELADSVRRARHALAIDDERDAFHPLLWDEIYEEEEAIPAARRGEKPRWIDSNRLEQVWFTGMHADVGGGYPDESLSYVSFLWMMEEAEKVGLRLSPVMIERFQALANSAGPIHDSRSGVGSYYRYQPRKVAVWMEPLDQPLVVRRHPDRKCGLIRVAKVHESVAARIASGTDRYAPLPLPAALEVVPPQRMGENVAQGGSGAGGAPVIKGPPRPIISEELRKRFRDPQRGADRVEAMAIVWTRVRYRRLLYFISLLLTLALATMPIWDDWLGTPPVLASGHGLVGRTIGLLGLFLPGFLAAIVDSWADHPFFVVALGTGLFLSNRAASRTERKLRDQARHIWNFTLDLPTPQYSPVEAQEPVQAAAADDRPEFPPPTRWQRLRRLVRWRLVPAAIAILVSMFFLWILLAVATRISLAFMERGTALCAAPPEPSASASATWARFHFDTRRPCHPSGLAVVKGRRYLVEMDVGRDWKDGGLPTDPRGLAAADLGLAGYVAVPLRRAVGARYLQPVAHIGGGSAGPAIQPLDLEQRGTPPGLWRGEFVADRTGHLSLFANEAMLPFGDRTIFYTHQRYGNRGDARVTIVEAGSADGAED